LGGISKVTAIGTRQGPKVSVYLERRRRTADATTRNAPEPSSNGTSALGAAPVDGVDTVVEAAQTPVGGLMMLVSSVRAPFLARARPPLAPPPTPMVALVVRVMLVRAIRFPWNDVAVPRVAELVTCQNTLQELALLMSTTREALAVVSADPI
jgi:hypothetical protein